jgi:hypothetical protein
MPALLAALLWAGVLQDGSGDERVRRLIRDLEHDDVEVRERAERELEAAGETAAPALRRLLENAKGTQNELTLRAGAILRNIERAAKIRAAYRDRAPLRLNVRDVELRTALAEIERQAGVRFEDPPPNVAARITLAADGRPLLAVLDDLCRQAGMSYRWMADGTIRLLPEPSPLYPTAYAGPFGVRVVEVRLERRTDFKERSTRLHLELETNYDGSLTPLGAPFVTLRDAKEDGGSALKIVQEEELGNPFGKALGQGGRMAAIQVAGAVRLFRGGASLERQDFLLSGLQPTARKVSLRGLVRCLLALETAEIRLKPEPKAQSDAGQIRVFVESAKGSHVTLNFAPKEGAPDEFFDRTITARLQENSFLAVDEQGSEHRGMIGVGADTVRRFYHVSFPTLGARKIVEIRMRLVTDVHVLEFPFALEDVELP